MSIEESVKLINKGDYAIIEFDLVGEKVNKFSTPIMVRFNELIDEVISKNFKAVVITSGKKNMFIAGADIEEIKAFKTKEDFKTAMASAHNIFNKIEDMTIPSIVAINGACMGGGCEMALACDYRLIVDDKKVRIGLPEVKLGIIPGFGGCVRLPRVVGLPNSLDIILNGKAVDAKKAKKIGLVDEVVSADLLLEKAELYAKEVIEGKRRKRKATFKSKSFTDSLMHSFVGKPMVFNQAKKTVMKFTKGFYPAPLKAIEVISKTYGMSNRAKAQEIEMSGFCEVAVTDVSKNLIDVFYLLEGVKKQNGVSNMAVKAKAVTHMGVLGAGVMGGGIAYQAADKGIYVRLKDISNQGLVLGFKAARELWEKKLKRKRINKHEFQQYLARVTGGLDYAGFQASDVVIEAIVEDMDIKKKVIAETAAHCKSGCIMATNTSSLSVTEMAKAHPNPSQFLGMHFFNPVEKMPLVEVIRGEQTSDEATATIFELAKKMGKTPVVVKDGPGFLVNRLLLPYMSEGMFLLQQGADIEKVDRFFTHDFGMPMGPFRLLDEVGLDVGLKVLKIFKQAFGDRIEVPGVADKIADTKRLGKKNKKGFYLYNDKGKQMGVDTSVYSELGLSSPKANFGGKECIERAIFQMINEAASALIEDEIVLSAKEVDLAMIMGTGFPPFKGGLLKYADTLGTEYISRQLEAYSAKTGGVRFKPMPALFDMAKGNKKFYYDILRFRSRHTLGDDSIKDSIREGRKY